MFSVSSTRYDIGATSSVLTQLESSTYSDVSWYTIVQASTLLQGVITSSGVLGEHTQNLAETTSLYPVLCTLFGRPVKVFPAPPYLDDGKIYPKPASSCWARD